MLRPIVLALLVVLLVGAVVVACSESGNGGLELDVESQEDMSPDSEGFEEGGAGEPTKPAMRGKVIGCTEPPVSGADVQLSGGAVDATTTDTNGCYEFDNLGDGTYSVTASDPGGTVLKPSVCNATITGGSEETCDFTNP